MFYEISDRFKAHDPFVHCFCIFRYNHCQTDQTLSLPDWSILYVCIGGIIRLISDKLPKSKEVKSGEPGGHRQGPVGFIHRLSKIIYN